MLKVLINGAHGRMGKISKQAIEIHEGLQYVGGLGRSDNLSEAIASINPDIVIDVTLPDCVFENAKTIIEGNAHPIIGASGLTHEQIDELKKICSDKKLGGIIAPNFSISAILMMQFSQQAAKYFDQSQITEYHHAKKIDAPSGTAIRTMDMIKQVRDGDDAPIQSVRMDHYVAHQEVVFGNEYESLTIRQDTFDRKAFIPGIQLACIQVVKKNTLHVGLEDFL